MQLASKSLVGRKHLLGRSAVEVSVLWKAEHNADLSVVDQRRAAGIHVTYDGETQSQDQTIMLTVENATALRDLLSTAIDSADPTW